MFFGDGNTINSTQIYKKEAEISQKGGFEKLDSPKDQFDKSAYSSK